MIKAYHVLLDEPVAIKLLREEIQLDAATVQRFIREAHSASRLKSEHVAAIRDVGSLAGRPYIVMELLEGVDLATRLSRQGPLEVAFVADLLLQACHAVDARGDRGDRARGRVGNRRRSGARSRRSEGALPGRQGLPGPRAVREGRRGVPAGVRPRPASRDTTAATGRARRAAGT